MRVVSIIAVLLLIAANALALLPEASAFQSYLSGGALALGLVVLGTILAGRSPKDYTGSAAAEAARPAPVPPHASQADAEIVNFLATLQAKGRFVDFLMDDINAHDDAQVWGGRARRAWRMQGSPAGALPDPPGARRERGVDSTRRSWLSGGRIPPAGQDQRAGALFRSTYPPRLEDGCGESAACSAQLDRPTSGNRSGGGGTEISGPNI